MAEDIPINEAGNPYFISDPDERARISGLLTKVAAHAIEPLDDDDATRRLIRAYIAADWPARAEIDRTLSNVCGWEISSLFRKAMNENDLKGE